MKAQLEQVVQQFSMAIEAQRLKLEEFGAQIQAANVLQDNERLEADTQIAAITAANPKPEESKGASGPTIVNIQPPVNVSLGL